MIYHIYWGTSGNSGLYMDEIYQTLKENGFFQRVFVNYYYPFKYGDKIFFRRGDIAHSKYTETKRKIFQLMEVLKGYVQILFYSIRDRPELINYSHVGQSYFFIPAYLKLLKKVSGAKLLITCHDVCPHNNPKSEMKNRRKIFHAADNLLIHNENSAKELGDIFKIHGNIIVRHIFPIMDLSKLSEDTENPYMPTDFLFIGHLRKDKGIEFLLKTWEEFHKVNKDAKLRICGKCQPNIQFNQSELEKSNVEFNLHFISDEDYYYYVKTARHVILPYLQGSNSGIISTVLSLGTDVITSDIPMFAENPLVSKEDMFESGNSQSLMDILCKKWLDKNEGKTLNKLEQYRKKFKNEVLYVYSNLAPKSR